MKALMTVAFLLGLVVLTSAAEPKIPSIAPMYGPKGTQDCTSFSINEDLHWWISALHCWEEGETVNRMTTFVIKADPTQDLVMMQTDRGAKSLRLAPHGPKIDDVVKILGYPFGNEALLTFHGQVSSASYPFKQVGGDFLVVDSGSCGGDSGSPMLNKHDEVISVVQNATNTPCGVLTAGPTWEALKTFADVAWSR